MNSNLRSANQVSRTQEFKKILEDWMLSLYQSSKLVPQNIMADSDSSEECKSKLISEGPRIAKKFMTKPILYDQQKQALTNLVDWFVDEETKDKTALVVMPTGSGKTGIIACLPYCLGGAVEEDRITDINLNKPILVIAPGLTIFKQLDENLQSDPFLQKVGLIKPGRLGYCVHKIMKAEDVRILHRTAPQYDIVLTNAQKWRRIGGDPTPNYEDLPEDLFSAVIVVEAHHLPSKQWKVIVDKFRPHAKVAFFTATPKRADGKDITTDFKRPDGSTYLKVAHLLTREEAIRDRMIRDIDPTILEDPDKDTVSLVLGKIKERMAEKNRDFPLPGNKKHTAMIITSNIGESEKVEEKCKDKELAFKSVLLHSKKPQWKREKIIKDIREGAYEVIIIVQMLLEGFDYPPISIAGILTKIGSRVKFAQFIGRAQRIVREKKEMEREGIKADLITHKYYQQRELLDQYTHPTIVETFED